MAVVLASVAVVGVVAYELRAPILTWAGGLLYHADPLAPSDAIVVLSGGSLDRDLEAADLLTEGYSSTIVLTREPEPPVVAELRSRGISVTSETEDRLDYLAVLGVPRTAVTVLQPVVESTQAEASLIADWAEARQMARLIVVTSSFHTSRTRYVFSEVFGDLNTEILVHPSRASSFTPATWWRTRPELRSGLFELQKYAYYRLTNLLGRSP